MTQAGAMLRIMLLSLCVFYMGIHGVWGQMYPPAYGPAYGPVYAPIYAPVYTTLPFSDTPMPESYTPMPESATPMPESYTPMADSATPLPEIATPTPELATPTPESATPESATPESATPIAPPTYWFESYDPTPVVTGSKQTSEPTPQLTKDFQDWKSQITKPPVYGGESSTGEETETETEQEQEQEEQVVSNVLYLRKYVQEVSDSTECTGTCGLGLRAASNVCYTYEVDGETQTETRVGDASYVVQDESLLTDLCTSEYALPDYISCDTGVECQPVEVTDATETYLFYWKAQVSENAACTKSCGGGRVVGDIKCQIYQQNSTTGVYEEIELIPENLIGYYNQTYLQKGIVINQCTADEKPVLTCNTQPCDSARIFIGEWGQCKRLDGLTCGTGFQSRLVRCESVLYGTAKPKAECEDATLENGPISSIDFRQACDMGAQCDSYVYKTGAWGRCDQLCAANPGDVGTKTREVVCVNATDVTSVFADSFCEGLTKPDISAACNPFLCKVYPFTVGAWSECSALCDGGTQTRTVTCDTQGDTSASCFGDEPSIQRPCNPQPCDMCNVDEDPCGDFGTCSNNACQCDDGYMGKYCSLSAGCGGAPVMANGECCPSNVFNKYSECCPLVQDTTTEVDLDGNCCNEGVDACGLCGMESVAVDALGDCCPKGGKLDNNGICCQSGIFDQCGLCDGDGSTCKPAVKAKITYNGAVTVFEDTNPDYVALRDTTRANLAASLGLDQSRISGLALRLTSGGRRLLASELEMEFQVTTDSDEESVTTDVLFEQMASTELPGFDPISAEDLAVQTIPTCENDYCEDGESAGGEFECTADCLTLLDCPAPFSDGSYTDPVGVLDTPCGSVGRCNRLTGECACYEGYTGDGCQECAYGFTVNEAKRTCIRAPSFVIENPENTPEPQSTPMSTPGAPEPETKDKGGVSAGVVAGAVVGSVGGVAAGLVVTKVVLAKSAAAKGGGLAAQAVGEGKESKNSRRKNKRGNQQVKSYEDIEVACKRIHAWGSH